MPLFILEICGELCRKRIKIHYISCLYLLPEGLKLEPEWILLWELKPQILNSYYFTHRSEFSYLYSPYPSPSSGFQHFCLWRSFSHLVNTVSVILHVYIFILSISWGAGMVRFYFILFYTLFYFISFFIFLMGARAGTCIWNLLVQICQKERYLR